MRIIAQKTDILNNEEFIKNATTKDYIYGITINVALTKDNKILTYNLPANIEASINTIENSTYDELNNFELDLLENILNNLNQKNYNKLIYLNINPFKTGPLTDENIEETTRRMNLYLDKIKKIIDEYPNLKINLHSINRSLVTIMKQKIKNHQIGYIINNNDLNFIDVNYYTVIMNVFNDTIIDILLKEKKEVNLYISSDYYLSFVYNHYVGEKSTHYRKEIFKDLGIVTSYPNIIYQTFKDYI